LKEFKLNPRKFVFARKEVQYLGHIVSADGVKPNPNKVGAVRDFPKPETVKELRRFLGMASYYRRFIPHFSDIAHPLHALTEKGSTFTWDENCQNAFNCLKEKLISTPILQYPDFRKEFTVECDASDVGLGAVLTQDDHVIAYTSRSLTSTERNYSATEKECLGVVWSLNKFGMYLEGRHFTMITDHR
jgi:hypothetical protein